MTETPCPRCGEPADGSFCSSCGARLGAAPCPACGEEAPPGDRFCTRCGASLGAGGGGAFEPPPPRRDRGSGRLGWGVAGLLLLALIAVGVGPLLRDDPEPSEGAAAGAPESAPLGPAPSVDLSSMTPREAADRLFTRVLSAWEAGEREEAARFLPMALGAYERARPLDADGHFHVAMLNVVGGEWAAALEAARAGLEAHPEHLLNLSVAAEAAAATGDTALALEYHRRFLDHYDAESASENPDYAAHAALLPGMLRGAERAVAEAGG